MPTKTEERMVPITVHVPKKMLESIQRAVELGITPDKCEFTRWAIAEKLISIFKYPLQCPYCKSRNYIPITKKNSSASFQCVDCSCTWDELFFRKHKKRV